MTPHAFSLSAPVAPGRPAFATGTARDVCRMVEAEAARCIALGDPAGALHYAAAVVDEVLARDVPPVALACGQGCAVCCYNQVSVTPAEGFALAEAVLAAEDGGRLAKGVRETAQRLGGLSREAMARARRMLPCPLLSRDVCLAYDARPLICRGFHSLDRAACESAFASGAMDAGAPSYPARLEVAEAARLALNRAALASGLPSGLMVAARMTARILDLGLETAGIRWLAGENVFA